MKLFRALLMVILSGVVVTTVAQEPMDKKSPKERPSMEERVEKKLDRMTENLELGEKQQILLKDIMVNYGEQKEALRNSNLSEKERMIEMSKLRSEEQIAVLDVLSDEQVAKMKEHMKQKMKHKHGQRPSKE